MPRVSKRAIWGAKMSLPRVLTFLLLLGARDGNLREMGRVAPIRNAIYLKKNFTNMRDCYF